MDTAQVLPSGMTAGGMARLDKLVNEFGFTALGFVETKYGKVFLAEKRADIEITFPGDDLTDEEYQNFTPLVTPGWKVVWGSRDAFQALDCPFNMAPAVRHQRALEAANGFLMDRNDVCKEV